MFGVFKSVVREAGKLGRKIVKTAKKAVKTVKRVAHQLPNIGEPLKAAADIVLLNQVTFVKDVLDGKRIDRAAVKLVKASVADVKDIAPYAQTVITLVPGVGTAASAALGAGIALAEGQPISKALVAGVKKALPGGPLAEASFDVAISVGKGKPWDEAAILAIPGLSSQEKKALISATKVVQAALDGQRIDEAAYKEAVKHLPPKARKALQVGIALGKGANVQKIIRANIGKTEKELEKKGKEESEKDPTLKVGKTGLTKEQERGYHVAIALYLFLLKPIEVVAIRSKLSKDGRIGFDLGIAARLGRKKVDLKDPDLNFANAVLDGAQQFTGSRLEKIVGALLAQEKKRALVMGAQVLKDDNARTWVDMLRDLLGL